MPANYLVNNNNHCIPFELSMNAINTKEDYVFVAKAKRSTKKSITIRSKINFKPELDKQDYLCLPPLEIGFRLARFLLGEPELTCEFLSLFS